jgi:two-component system response regulator AtoC
VTDPILAARLEALRLLADHVSDRVMVLDRDFTIIYANESAWSGAEREVHGTPQARCYEAVLGGAAPCPHCPAIAVFESSQVRSVSCSTGQDGSACGIVQAFPLMPSQGKAAAVLVLVKASGDREHTASPPEQAHPEAIESSQSGASRLRDMIGQSAPMQQLFEMIRLVADSHATVLLQGESGTGKELVARTIHHLSRRREKPFVVVDCGSLPESLLESELFGHVKGAFTGALASKQGLFEAADGGTIFLDEIADTSAPFQAKLLRVLQEGEIKPVGTSRSTKVDVRVISASNKDLMALVQARAFRADLYYRLAVLPLLLPPLRDRREDIPLLVRHFVEASCKRHGKTARVITAEAMQALTNAPWPGNVRELQHLIERAVLTAPGSQLGMEVLLGRPSVEAAQLCLRSVARHAVQSAERGRIEEALRQASGKRALAARLLKISRAGLYNKLRAYQLQ